VGIHDTIGLSESHIVPPRNAMDNIVVGRSILLTGAGGSIGSALAKTILRLEPRCLILLDNSERNLNEIDLELAQMNRHSHVSVLGDICDAKLLSQLFRRYHPEVVYHAAAFKHVPLMENNPFAAVRNNALGTASLASISLCEGVAKFVLVSTDKAVNPISIMGASKRVAELVLLSLNNPNNQMTAVRLVNVLGSQGSVVPRFLAQISRGGPVTVTHPDATRYFVTTDEAVDLILLVSGLEEGGGIFVPQLGAPVKILDLALELIAQARSQTGTVTPLTFTGLRSGDKISEELLAGDESAAPTADRRVLRVKTKVFPADALELYMQDLARRVEQRNLASMIETLCQIVPDYRPTECLYASTQGSSA
jgi:FlaA1/EpsC-like NDP-sugar epimerase